MSRATARARANIAFAKYWGKSDVALNLPAVPSVSVTLEPLVTETTVELDASLDRDVLLLDGLVAEPAATARASRLLDALRARAGDTRHARVTSVNRFPTASGLASSASGFAALAAAGSRALGLSLTLTELSAVARAASASAARSIFAGFVALPAGAPGDPSLAAVPLHPVSHWDVRVVVAVADEGPKATGSTDGMEHTRRTSPYYAAWVAAAPLLAREVEQALAARDLPRLGVAMEQSTLAMHACAMAAAPGVLYIRPVTLAALATVRKLREGGLAAYATMDAGPHVKVLCSPADSASVEAALAATPGVLRTIAARPGPGVEWLE